MSDVVLVADEAVSEAAVEVLVADSVLVSVLFHRHKCYPKAWPAIGR